VKWINLTHDEFDVVSLWALQWTLIIFINGPRFAL